MSVKKINELLAFYDKECNLSFDGKNKKSISKSYELKRNETEILRYHIDFSPIGFSFLKDFIDKLQVKIIDSLNDNKDDDYGYIYPKSKFTKNYTDQNILNTSSESTLQFIRNLKKDINSLNSLHSNEILSRYRLKIITGKVGSGKSTYIRYLYKKFNQDLFKENILFTIVNYSDFKLEDYTDQDVIRNTFTTNIKKLFFKKTIETYIKVLGMDKLNNLRFLSDYDIENNSNIEDLRRVLNDTTLSENEIVNKIEELDSISLSAEYLTKIFKYIYSKLEYKPLIVIDGFDNLDPQLIKNFTFYIKNLKEIIYTSIIDNFNITYIMTLRNCTFEEFQIRYIPQRILVAPSESCIIKKTIKSLAIENQFIRRHQNTFIEIFELIIKRLEINFNTMSYGKSPIEFFDFNYRLFLTYLYNILCFIISHFMKTFNLIDTTDEILFDEFIVYLSTNDYSKLKELLKSKSYILDDILLLKNYSRYRVLYKIDVKYASKTYLIDTIKNNGVEFKNQDNISFFDNIYNYTLTKELFTQDSLFPLLVKVRILQIFKFQSTYSSEKDIKEKLQKLGYKTEYFKSIIEDLHNSKFIKVKNGEDSSNKNIFKYDITNRGLLTIDILSKKNIYIQHIIPFCLLPENSENYIQSYAPYREHKDDAVRIAIINSIYFLNIIRIIELEELKIYKNFENKEQTYNLFPIKKYLIYNDMRAEIKNITEKILLQRYKNYTDKNKLDSRVYNKTHTYDDYLDSIIKELNNHSFKD